MSSPTYLAAQHFQFLLNHDRKNYDEASDACEELFTGLYDGAHMDKVRAANAYTDAFIFHDIVDDGIEEVEPHADIPPEVVEAAAGDRESIYDDPVWDFVGPKLDETASFLGLPGEWGKHTLEFFRSHSAFNEDEDLDEDERQDHREEFRRHAREAKEIEYSEVNPERAEEAAESYVRLVDLHDQGGDVEQGLIELYSTLVG